MNFDWTTLQPLALDYGLKFITALLVFIIGKWLAHKLTDVTMKLMKTRGVDATLTKFLEGIIFYALLVIVMITAAGQLGIQTTSFIAVFGAASLAIGLALKDSLSNFSSGVMLILFRPFSVGDVVNIGGETGKVESISIFNTNLNTGDNQKKIIPNGAISNSTITNITANPTRRVDLVIGIGYDDDIRKAKKSLEQIVTNHPGVLKEPAPTIAVSELADSSVNFVVRPWVATPDYWTVYFALIEEIKLTFDEQGISFPYPQQDVHLYKQENGSGE